MSRFLYGTIFGAILMYMAMHYHVVRGDDGFFLVPKITNNLSDIYTDIRGFDLAAWKQNKALAAAMMKNDQGGPLEDASLRTFRDSVHGIVSELFSE